MSQDGVYLIMFDTFLIDYHIDDSLLIVVIVELYHLLWVVYYPDKLKEIIYTNKILTHCLGEVYSFPLSIGLQLADQ